MFSHGLDSADVMVCSDLLCNACASICNTACNEDLQLVPVCYQVYELVPNGKIIAFRSSPDCTVENLEHQGKDLVPSTTMGTLFDFIATKVNHSFSIHKAAAEVFSSLHVQLSMLKIDISSPLIITGDSLGGSIASLYTLWLLDTIYSKPTESPKQPKRPICVTFGAPLLGDIRFQRAISERLSWIRCFLHMVFNQDPIPKLFVSPHSALSAEPTSLATPTYKPFGSFLFCSESGCALFDQPESVFELMVAMSLESVGNMDLNAIQINYYGLVLDQLKKNAICKGNSELGDSVVNPLRVGLTLQLEAIGVIKTQQQQQDNNTKTLIEKIEKRQEDALKRKNVVDPTKKLNDSKISMTYLEWYKKVTVSQGGYYDGYKNPGTKDEKKSKGEIVKHQTILRQYWKDMVEQADQMPQKEGVSFRTRWLYAGTNYRRMVEPLDIADYYKKGRRDYINSERSEHYKLMEKWFNDEKKPSSQTSNPNERKKASLTEDSCFWARVEEAVISCGVLNDGMSSQENTVLAKQNLKEFEDYVMGLIGNCSVSPEIFLEKSTFMEWWKTYEKIMGGTSYESLLADFMRNKYKEYV